MKTLYNTVQQYESILDPNQDQTMSRMADDMIRNRIREYCTNTKENGFVANLHLEITKIDKDKNGWYVETKSNYVVYLMQWSNFKSYYNYCLAKGCKMDEQKGFLIEDLGIYFRWRKHEGVLLIRNSHYLESTDGLPEELNVLFLDYCCGKSKKLTVHNNINLISIQDIKVLQLLGEGCKNVIISPKGISCNLTVPDGVKIYRPKDTGEHRELSTKIAGY